MTDTPCTCDHREEEPPLTPEDIWDAAHGLFFSAPTVEAQDHRAAQYMRTAYARSPLLEYLTTEHPQEGAVVYAQAGEEQEPVPTQYGPGILDAILDRLETTGRLDTPERRARFQELLEAPQ